MIWETQVPLRMWGIRISPEVFSDRVILKLDPSSSCTDGGRHHLKSCCRFGAAKRFSQSFTSYRDGGRSLLKLCYAYSPS